MIKGMLLAAALLAAAVAIATGVHMTTNYQ